MSAPSPRASVFRAMLWKELREGRAWAAGVFLIEAAGMACVVGALSTPPDSPVGSGVVAIPSVMNLYNMLSFGAPLAGIVIGLAQMLRDGRGDRWAFLTHRPVPRTAVFWAKALGGVVLYTGAYGVPLVAAVAWAAWPGHFAVPFDVRMLEPGAMDFLCGTACYFGALYTGARSGRWYGTRGVGVVAALACFALEMSVPAAGVAVVGVLLMLGVFAVAAWGAFIAGGDPRQQPGWGRAAGATTIAVGLVLMYGIATAIVEGSVGGGQDASSAPPDTDYRVSSDGVALQVVSRPGDGSIIAVNDMSGHPLARYADSMSRAGLGLPQSDLAEATLRLWAGGVDVDYRSAAGHFLALGSTAGRTAWYYVYRERAIAVFDVASARLVGWIGPAGYSAGPNPPRVRFPASPRIVSEVDAMTKPLSVGFDLVKSAAPLLAFPEAVYRLDFDRQRADTLFVAQPGDTIRLADRDRVRNLRSPALAQRFTFDVIVTTRNLQIVTPGLAPLSVTLDSGMASAEVIAVSRPLTAPGEPTFVRFSHLWQDSVPDALLELARDGTVAAQYPLPAVRSPGRTPLRSAVFDGVSVPPVINLLPVVAPGEFVMNDRAEIVPLTATAVMVGLICGLITFALSRAYGFRQRRQVVWTLVSLGLGVFGLLLMLATVDLPTVERCPRCRSRRPAEDELCRHCGSEFTAPSAIGVEVFDDQRTATQSLGASGEALAVRTRSDAWAGTSMVVPGVGTWRAILWKECREVLPWGVAALAIMAFAAWHAVVFTPEGYVGYWRPTRPLWEDYPAIALAEAFVAVLLGASQSLRERRGDRWAFLTHRPVSKTTLFLGKVTAGVACYLLATTIPLVAAVAWAAAPAHRAMPFDARMALPGVADLLCGLVYYAAALLIGLRDARWLGTRWVPLAAALLCTEWVMSAQTFAGALAGCAAGLAVLGVAACAAFVHQGAGESQPPIARVATGVAVGTGLLVAIGFPLIVLLTAFPRRSQHRPDRPPATRTVSRGIISDGLVAEVVRQGARVVEVNDLTGHALARYADSAQRAQLNAGEVTEQIWFGDASIRKPYRTYRSDGQFFERLNACALLEGLTGNCDTGLPRYFWYYAYGPRLIALYDTKPVRLVGWLGPAGFSDGPQLPSARFPDGRINLGGDYCSTTGSLGIDTKFECGDDNSDLLAFRSGVFHVDLSQPGVTLAFTPQPGDSVIRASSAAMNPLKAEGLPAGASGTDTRVDAVVTQRYVDITSSLGRVALRRDTLGDYQFVEVVRPMLAPGAPLFLRFSTDLPQRDTLAEPITEIGVGGRVLAHLVLPAAKHPEWQPLAPYDPLWASTQFDGFMWQHLASAQTIRAILVDVNRRIPALGWAIDIPILGPPVTSLARLMPSDRVVAWFLVTVVALVCGTLGFHRARRRAFSSAAVAAWTAVGAMLGLFGMLLMSALLDRDVREPCPACGHQRAVTRERCEHCGGTFATPRPDGTELFGEDADPFAGAELLAL